MRRLAPLVLLTALASPGYADTIPFDGSWKEQGFLRLFSNEFDQNGSSLDVTSDGTVSLLWRAVSDAQRSATQASWRWSVSEGVPATDLSRKGGDDRNLAIYFAFTDPATAQSINPNRAARLLRQDTTKVLVYVWGGGAKTGPTQSPYLPGLKTIARQAAGTGSHSESVDLAADFRRAFGAEPGVLVGVGITADSDDTDTKISARVSNLVVK